MKTDIHDIQKGLPMKWHNAIDASIAFNDVFSKLSYKNKRKVTTNKILFIPSTLSDLHYVGTMEHHYILYGIRTSTKLVVAYMNSAAFQNIMLATETLRIAEGGIDTRNVFRKSLQQVTPVINPLVRFMADPALVAEMIPESYLEYLSNSTNQFKYYEFGFKNKMLDRLAELDCVIAPSTINGLHAIPLKYRTVILYGADVTPELMYHALQQSSVLDKLNLMVERREINIVNELSETLVGCTPITLLMSEECVSNFNGGGKKLSNLIANALTTVVSILHRK